MKSFAATFYSGRIELELILEPSLRHVEPQITSISFLVGGLLDRVSPPIHGVQTEFIKIHTGDNPFCFLANASPGPKPCFCSPIIKMCSLINIISVRAAATALAESQHPTSIRIGVFWVLSKLVNLHMQSFPLV